MSAPKLTAKFRMRGKIPFSIESFSGKIFRCGVCGKIYYSRDEIEHHLSMETYKEDDKLQFPELDKNLLVSVIYAQDVRDLTNPKYPRLQKGDKMFKKTAENNEAN